MRTARIGYDNLTLRPATILTSSADAVGYPVSNLSSEAVWQKWRSSSTVGDQSVITDFGSAQTVKLVAIKNYLAHVGGTVKVEYWTGAAWANFGGGTGLLTLPNPNQTGIAAIFYEAGVSTAKIRITFTNTGAVNSYVEIGVLYTGSYFEPTVSLAPGYGLRRVSLSTVVRTPSGSRSANRRGSYWALSGSQFQFEPETDRAGFSAFAAFVGLHQPFLFAINPDDPGNFMFYGRLDSDLPFTHVTPMAFSLPFAFSEDV